MPTLLERSRKSRPEDSLPYLSEASSYLAGGGGVWKLVEEIGRSRRMRRSILAATFFASLANEGGGRTEIFESGLDL